MARWRYRTPTETGEWHPTRKEAEDAAIRAKLGNRHEWGGRFYPDVFTRIEEETA